MAWAQATAWVSEQQRQVAGDAFGLQGLGGLYALPGGGDLDQHPLARDAGKAVQLDDLARPEDGALGVEGQAGVDFGGDAARHDAQDFAAEGHQQPVGQLGQRRARVVGDGLVQQMPVGVFLHGLEDKRRVGGGVGGAVGAHGLEVAGVGDHGRVLAQGLELVGHKTKSLRGMAGEYPYIVKEGEGEALLKV